MGEDNDLEKRAIEELLRETDRARVRAETMGPAGWLKCPLRGTNKRFLLNTLRSTGLQRRNDEGKAEDSSTKEFFKQESPEHYNRRHRSRTPPKKRGNSRGHTKHKHHSSSHRDKRLDRDKHRSHRHRDDKDRRQKDGQNGEKQMKTL